MSTENKIAIMPFDDYKAACDKLRTCCGTSTIIKSCDLVQAIDDAVASGSGGEVSLQEKSVKPSTSYQYITPDSEYDGLSKVTVESMNLQLKTVTENGNITPDSDYDGLSMVIVDVPTSIGSSPSTCTVEIYSGTATIREIMSTRIVDGVVTGLHETLDNPTSIVLTDVICNSLLYVRFSSYPQNPNVALCSRLLRDSGKVLFTLSAPNGDTAIIDFN